MTGTWRGRALLDRMSDQFTVDDGCWLWTGRLDDKGYPGSIHSNGRRRRPYQLLYELLVGPIPKGMTLDHLCHTSVATDCAAMFAAKKCPHRRCVRPDHLEPITQAEQVQRGRSPWRQRSLQTHCYRGHAFDDENTYVTLKGQRNCRACHRAKEAERRRKIAATVCESVTS